jgi:hypothetical protein
LKFVPPAWSNRQHGARPYFEDSLAFEQVGFLSSEISFHSHLSKFIAKNDEGGNKNDRLYSPVTPDVHSLCTGFYRGSSGQAGPCFRRFPGLLPDLRQPLSGLPERMHYPILSFVLFPATGQMY